MMADSISTLAAVPIFATVERGGKVYTEADLDAMVANFNVNKDILAVPAVLGHDEEQLLLKSSLGLPAAGWCDRVYRQGRTLYADFRGVPDPVKRLVKGRAYRRVSAEVYDEPPPGCGGDGRTLRRVAFLGGGDIPVIKTLGDIPVPESWSEDVTATPFRSAIVRPAGEGCYAVFSEVMPVNRERMLQCLAERGMDLSQVTDAVTDGLLAEVLRVVDSALEHAEDVDEEAEEAADEEAADDSEAGSEDEAEEDGAGEDEDEEQTGRRPEIRRYSEADMTAAEITAIVDTAVAQAVGKALDGRVKGVVEKIDQQQSRLEKFAEEQHAAHQRGLIEAFLDSRVKEGKVLPSELDEKEPSNLRARLYRADARNVVTTFSEGGKEQKLTALDLELRAIDRRPAFRFGERLAQPAQDARGEDAEVSQLEQHYERFSEQFARHGLDKAALVAAFRSARKRSPKLTADEYLNSH